MWQLESIKATNLCAFRELEYAPKQGGTTLVFGDNMDDDSQNSNGSGKSALIEAVAISLTGETLRKVNMDEIINDSSDEAELEAVLANPSENETMTVIRRLCRKKPQSISIVLNHAEEAEEIAQSSVNDYNKYILDKIGLSKDDIFSNYILTAKKYKSFLSSSDREKKDIINRFSNGILVDESIEALHDDISPVEEELLESEKEVAECNGRVSALSEEIERAVQESANRSENKRKRIAEWTAAISEKRSEIREFNQRISSVEECLDKLDEIDVKMQNLEESDLDFHTIYQRIQDYLDQSGLPLISDFAVRFLSLKKDKKALDKSIEDAEAEIELNQHRINFASEKLDEINQSYDENLSTVNEAIDGVTQKINDLSDLVKKLRGREVELMAKRSSTYARVSSLEKQLAGIIVCPKCKHEFTLAGDLDVQATKKQLNIEKENAEKVEQDIVENQNDYQKCVEDGKDARQKQNELNDYKTELKKGFQMAKEDLENLELYQKRLNRNLDAIQSDIDKVEKLLRNLKKDMFDETFDLIDRETNKNESSIKSAKLEIANAKGAIESYEESIREIDKSSETDVISSLKESKVKYDKELSSAIKNKEDVEQKLNELKVQEANFIEFKTHLANTKIDAISKITNDFLETIGSDIRVSFSGFTVLKSGKVRDKISISLIRDGMDCGSFDKFSRGEQTRVELACILAMHELTNANCQDGLGLNLLIIDEILDATDEQGLTNVFKALNETHITSLVVSHGNIAENYPNRLIVHKQNGVSFI